VNEQHSVTEDGIAGTNDTDREVVITVSHVGKCYHIYDKPEDRLKQAIIPRLYRLGTVGLRQPGQRYFREFWALRDVSFEVGRGELVGIVGRNGAGKSTLLQVIVGTMTPTEGMVQVDGRVAALLELGSGFNPEFTGRENVYLNASLLGLSSGETDEKFDEIERFADIGSFIDQPVKSYSSGMMMRLAFAVQTAVDPSVLIVDEALAVGDARFQKKCYERLERYRREGGTALFVTHDTGIVTEICSRAIILEEGRIFDEGEPHRIAREYHRLLFGPDSDKPTERKSDDLASSKKVHTSLPRAANGHDAVSDTEAQKDRSVRYGSQEVQIISVGVRDDTGTLTQVLEMHKGYEFFFGVRFNTAISTPVSYGFIIATKRGLDIFGTKSGLYRRFMPPSPAGTTFECRFKTALPLVPSTYFLSVAIAPSEERSNEMFYDCWFDALELTILGAPRCFMTGLIDLPGELTHGPLQQ
jgi:lipopolysaccharide transport system ATP-binding protein